MTFTDELLGSEHRIIAEGSVVHRVITESPEPVAEHDYRGVICPWTSGSRMTVSIGSARAEFRRYGGRRRATLPNGGVNQSLSRRVGAKRNSHRGPNWNRGLRTSRHGPGDR